MSSNNPPINVSTVMLTRPVQEHADKATGAALSLKPQVIWSGVKDDKLWTTSISLIWNENLDILADDQTYLIFNPIFPTTPQKLSSLYKEWEDLKNPDKIIMPRILVNEIDNTGFKVEDEKLVNGNQYLTSSIIIGKGRAIKLLEPSEYKTDSKQSNNKKDKIAYSW